MIEITPERRERSQPPQKPKPERKRGRLKSIILGCLAGALLLVVTGVIGFFVMLHHYGSELPDYQQLENYNPPVVTRIYAGNGTLFEEYAREKRLFVPIDTIPKPVIHAFLAAEDKGFFTHGGLDFSGITRAVFTNVYNKLVGRRPIGASTITQQVAKNFLLTNEVSYERKIKEAILAYRIERAFTKDQILELYLNEIYLGVGSYGVAAAAQTYFDKALNELTVSEAAYLAALPKGPNNYNPLRRHAAAVARRNWVIDQMRSAGYLDKAQAEAAQAEPLVAHFDSSQQQFHAHYFAEEVRRDLYKKYGEKGLYEAGLSVRTSLDPRLQMIASRVLKQGLENYDRRHGWRGAIKRYDSDIMANDGWAKALTGEAIILGDPEWRLAVVTAVTEGGARIGLADGTTGFVPLSEMTWARKWMPGEYLGSAVTKVADVLELGDVVPVAPVAGDPGHKTYSLKQIPAVGGALVAEDPHTGRVLAMVGGFSYGDTYGSSEFNRATQALRQPGSAFKPFVYAAALESGLTPSSLVLDAPFVVDQGPVLGLWKPSNYTEDFYGPSTLRTGLEKSRNLMTVRLAQHLGMKKVVDYARRFDIQPNMPPTLSMSLGAGETTLLKLTNAYGMLVNGGKKIEPSLIDRIQDRYGKTIFREDARACEGCDAAWNGQEPPQLPDPRAQVIKPQTAYQVVSMLEGVVQRGTGRSVAAVGKPLAGKTGTTNDYFDAWFVGFSPDLVVGVFIGFDQPRSLGKGETGSVAAAPIFRDFMKDALKDKPGTPFRIPPGLMLVRVNPQTGQPVGYDDPRGILEAFLPGTEPNGEMTVLDGSTGEMRPATATPDSKIKEGTGGLY
ncbi:penicillin-binding protein 1A [Govanella unica]|uniref:Penicillin-binding protein 1A n=1 Tax=Govanella unica TaxID=2975056 RepID=A0A9X3TXJ9_9PROT|nr:penicillin-binding protein 1A [Govania unica]MDA5193544.1 penicillin-binding protein 1A [Govania unica]